MPTTGQLILLIIVVALFVAGGVLSFARVRWDRSLEGKTLADWARREGLAPTPENGARLVVDAELKGGANAIFHAIDEGDVARIMRLSFVWFPKDFVPPRERPFDLDVEAPPVVAAPRGSAEPDRKADAGDDS